MAAGKSLSPIYLDELDDNIPSIRRSKRNLIAFGWYGGKYSHLGWLLPLLPKSSHYCEPYGGSAAVLLNRAASPLETYNDMDGDLVNFFKVLRNRKDDLIELLSITPFSREEFLHAIVGSDSDSDLERARKFYIKARQARTGLAQRASLGRWANCVTASRAGMAGAVSRWWGGVDGLKEISERLLRVQMENRPAVDVIRAYDTPDTLFYCDPPYLHETRGDTKAYKFEMSDFDHLELADRLKRTRGMAAVSGYRSDYMDFLFKGWHRFDAPEMTNHSTKDKRNECLWTNYKVAAHV
jgi:DNA adenine methylase